MYIGVESDAHAYAGNKSISTTLTSIYDETLKVKHDYFTKTAQTRTDSIHFYIYVNAEKKYVLYDFTGWTITDKLESISFDRKDDLKIKPGSVKIYYAVSNRALAQCKELDNTGGSYQDQSFSFQVPV